MAEIRFVNIAGGMMNRPLLNGFIVLSAKDTSIGNRRA